MMILRIQLSQFRPPEKHVCKPRSLKEVREQQRTFEKKGRKRERIVDDNYESEVEGPQEIKRTRKSAQIATEKLTNCFKDCDNIVTENDESNIEEPENNKRILRSARFNDSKFKSVASDDADGEEKSGVSKPTSKIRTNCN
uniref:Uncharacterized protein n=1 Tax=Panagrolaimus superbus TaxID=310955 RepID=A0A914ZAT8_9BILA